MQFQEASDSFDQYLDECAASVDKIMSWSKREVLQAIDSFVLDETAPATNAVPIHAPKPLGDSLPFHFTFVFTNTFTPLAGADDCAHAPPHFCSDQSASASLNTQIAASIPPHHNKSSAHHATSIKMVKTESSHELAEQEPLKLALQMRPCLGESLCTA